MLQNMHALQNAARRSGTTHIPFLQPQPTEATRSAVKDRATTASAWLDRHSIALLRISMGSIILLFGVMKYFPGASPAENLVMATTHLLTLGLIPDHVALVLTATLECFIGLALLTGVLPRVTVCLQAMWLVGILSPAVLLPQRLFSGPGHAPSLEGQYVLKDVILVAACVVIATSNARQKKAEHWFGNKPGTLESSDLGCECLTRSTTIGAGPGDHGRFKVTKVMSG